MADYKTVMREYDRMCNNNGSTCVNCPISARNNGSGIACTSLMCDFPEKAERIVLQWAEKTPIMTNRRKFEEVFGFNIATMFEVNRGNADWLDEEYEGGNNNDS